VLRELEEGRSATTRLQVGGEPYLASVMALRGGRTQDWLVGIVVPEAYYLRDFLASRRQMLVAAGLVMLAIVVAGAIGLRAVRGDLGRLIGATTRLRGFDFAPTPAVSSRTIFRDVAVAAESLEQAKTALRALGKYVPLDLVRQLYEARAEPTLGGTLQDVTILFSDIEGFTTVSEKLPIDTLAVALGRYLEALTTAIHGTGGIIDKYTGDGVMALWNTPTLLPRHPWQACEAALRCEEAAAALFASPAWSGLPAWPTRFGIHRAEVSVGHFGAPDRMSFTAMGDGVNLAARLEGLGKQYGTRMTISASVAGDVADAYLLRRLDRVAVKGKHDGVEVFELLGRAGVALPAERAAAVRDYQVALDAYFSRRFDAALVLLDRHPQDPPALVLAARCRQFLAAPPPPDWNGVYVAREK
jgi:adenylate cyclase